jgi:hypothetical protein
MRSKPSGDISDDYISDDYISDDCISDDGMSDACIEAENEGGTGGSDDYIVYQ